MKKLLMGSLMILALGTTAFAGMHDRNDMPGKPLPPHQHKMRMDNCRRNPEFEKSRIMIDEKRLEIRKELLNDKPDWNKIERLNIEVATQEAKNKTLRMKEHYNNQYNNTTTLNSTKEAK